MGMSDQTILSQLNDSLANPKFEVWNTTSLSHLYLAGLGVNGKEASDKAILLLRRFLEYLYEGKPQYISKDKVQRMLVKIDELNRQYPKRTQSQAVMIALWG
jgi:hypothetical protein